MTEISDKNDLEEEMFVWGSGFQFINSIALGLRSTTTPWCKEWWRKAAYFMVARKGREEIQVQNIVQGKPTVMYFLQPHSGIVTTQ